MTRRSRVAATPEFFFRAALPAMLRRNRLETAMLKGRIQFVVTGVGAWTVTLGPCPQVTPSVDLEGDLLLFFSKESFERILAGDSLKAGEGFVPEGDQQLLAKFSKLLLAPSTKPKGHHPFQLVRPAAA